MVSRLIILTSLYAFAVACKEDLRITTVEPQPILNEDACRDSPETQGCSVFIRNVLKLHQMIPINSYQDNIVRLQGNAFHDELEITIDGKDLPVFKTSETDAFFVTPRFDSPGIKTGVLRKQDRSIEFKLFILAENIVKPETLTEPSVVCQGLQFMLPDHSVVVGTKSCEQTTASGSCTNESEADCPSAVTIEDISDVLAKAPFSIEPNVSGAVSFAWSKVWGRGAVSFASPTARTTTVTAAADGDYLLKLVAKDAAGGSAQKFINFTWDATPPTLTHANDILTKQAVNLAPIVSGATSYAWTQLSGPGTLSFASPTENVTAVTASADGLYTLRFTASDAAGNSAQKDINFTWDTTAPLIAGVSDIFTKSLHTIAPTVTGASSYAWSQISGPGPIMFASPAAASSSVFAATDGSYVIRLTATDAAGNSASQDINFTWDTLPPLITFADSQRVFAKTATISPSVSGGDTYDWTIVSAAGAANFSSSSSRATTMTVDTFGSYLVNFAAEDRAGNVANLEIRLAFISPYSRSLVAGYYHSCAVLSDNSVKCWGENSEGQLGYGNTTDLLAPAVSSVDLGPGKTAQNIFSSSSTYHGCALLNDNSVKCWGANWYGQLGIGNTTNLLAPAAAIAFGPAVAAADMAVGREHSCALLASGSVTCWGYPRNGQLGLGWSDNEEYPSPLTATIDFGLGQSAWAIAAGSEHSCAILSSGAVKCWGMNDSGQLGMGSPSYYLPAPAAAAIDLGPGKTAQALALGYAHSCALLNDNSVKCWGDNWSGGLGLGNTTDLLAPAATAIDLGPGVTALAISAGISHTCALLNDNSVKCWGENASGQLGLGDTTDVWAPSAAVNLGAGLSAVDIALGGNHTCARLNDNSIKCWGDNSSGQLGYGNITDLLAPAAGSIGL